MASSRFHGVGIVTGTIFIVIVLLVRHLGHRASPPRPGRGRATSEALSRPVPSRLAWGA